MKLGIGQTGECESNVKQTYIRHRYSGKLGNKHVYEQWTFK